ncbi:MAG: hypothetical protein FWB74_02205 [Defluviitaleaceae bacterium]|nr:hypothetical protein [Defluviitaleaceae bacterium]
MFTRKLLKDLLTNLVAFVFIFAIFSFVWVWLIGSAPVGFLWAVFPFFALMWVREQARNFYMFAVIHLIVAVLPAVLVLFVLRGVSDLFMPVLVLSLCMSGFSTGKRFGVNTDTNTATAIGLVAVLALMVISLRAADVYPEGAGITTLFSGLVLIGLSAIIMQIQMGRMDIQLALLGNRVKNSPKGVVRSNYIIMGGFLGIMMVFGVAAILVPDSVVASGLLFLAQAAVWIFMLPFAILGFIGGMFYQETYEYFPEIELPGVYVDVPPMPLPEIYEEAPPYYEQSLLSVIFEIVAFVIVGIVLVFIFIALYKAMRRRFGRGRQSAGSDFEAEKLEMELRRRGIFARKDKTLRHPVRRAYRKKVNAHIKKGTSIFKHHHHENIADIIRENEDIDELTKLYEVARYGRQS